jgi:hypothetical protein
MNFQSKYRNQQAIPEENSPTHGGFKLTCHFHSGFVCGCKITSIGSNIRFYLIISHESRFHATVCADEERERERERDQKKDKREITICFSEARVITNKNPS